jgi:GlpG protein
MRLVGKVDKEGQAKLFSDYLNHLKIDNQVIEEADKTFEIWVHSEDDVDHSIKLFDEFLKDPNAQKYKSYSKKVAQAEKVKKREKKKRAPYIDVRTQIFNRARVTRGNLTLFFIIICVLIGIFSGLGKNHEFLRKFYITDFQKEGNLIQWSKIFLREVRNGQFWRLITPIFIHFHFLHIFFNMLWLWDLGNMIEARKGSWYLGILIVVIAIPSNLAQYIVSHPNFGGMSGVVYGLLGYIWMKGKYDPASKLYLHKSTVSMMLIWYFLCLIGVIPHVANAVHTVGLIIGVAWGYLSSNNLKQYLDK